MIGLVLALAGAVVGGVANVVAIVLAAGGGGTDVAPVVAGGGTAIMATALAYVVRQLLAGNLVARSTVDTEKTLLQLIDEGAVREKQMLAVLRSRKRVST